MNYETDEWRAIKSFPNYEINTYGTIVNLTTGEYVDTNYSGRLLKADLRDSDNKVHTVNVKDVMGETFCGEGREGYEIWFKDGNTQNNYVGNLEWQDKRRRSNNADEFRSVPIRVRETGQVYESIQDYHDQTGEPFSSIKRAVNNPERFVNRRSQHLEFADVIESED